jgi:ATP-binding cassette subfamily F protein uup
MALISLRNIKLAFGGPPILDDISLQIEKGERICLLGRNGTGKSTLLKLIAGELPPDAGALDRQQGLRIARLSQDVPQDLQGTIYETVAESLGQESIDASQKIDQVLSRLKLDPGMAAATLSGGMLRRLMLARALVTEPDILLLDEPTNHLDIESISWMEEFLLRSNVTLVFVTHDRSFLRRLANRIVEIDRGRLYDFACDYDTFLQRKEEHLHAESQERNRFDKKLAEEEIWIRKGIKARRTRNEGRVRALKKMREEKQQRRNRLATSQMNLLDAEKSGRLVADVKNISFAYGDNQIIKDFSTTITRGDRIGIIGPNGIGKSTLLKLLLGQLQPQAGNVKLGTNLEIVYFDQLREQLDPDKTVQQNLSGDQDTVMIGDRSKHVIGYLQDFLFTPDRARTPVRILSGGERNRLLLAKLFTRQTNLLILDEPTNDLDLETLDLLEELLADFKGTLFLVSHDRDFLNRVVSSTIALEGNGQATENIGGYDDWLQQRPELKAPSVTTKTKSSKPARQRARKLSFKENQELQKLPQQIEELETAIDELHSQMADPGFYREDGDKVAAAKQKLETLETDLESAFNRWQELDSIAPE